jgi:hypothetical protein
MGYFLEKAIASVKLSGAMQVEGTAVLSFPNAANPAIPGR